MSFKTYLWIEYQKDKASYIFWKTLMNQLCPNVIVESKKNNTELIKAVKTLTDENNSYIIVYDNSFDNLQVYQEQKRLKKYIDSKKNIFLMDIIYFEYILLEFNNLIDWIYAPNDEFLIKRKKAIDARNKLIRTIKSGETDYKAIKEIIDYDKNLENHNIEQLSTKLLFDLTRNTGFEVSKGKIGDCWIQSCCKWDGRQEDDICGLDDSSISLTNKMKSIYTGTSLSEEFFKVGLEVSLC